MSLSKRIILITGGNSGVGLSLAKMLMSGPSNHVIITSRNVEKGQAALKELQSLKQPGSAEMLQLEVTKPESITQLAQNVEKSHGRLDALVNNAAQAAATPGTSLFDHMQQCFTTNVCGPAVMIEQFLPLLQKSTGTPRIINVGSGAGSLGLTLGPNGGRGYLSIPYMTSKAALNMLSSVEVVMFRQKEINVKVFTYSPGFCVSNLSEFNTAANGAKPTDDGARPMVAILNGDRDEEHGANLNSDGGHHPW